MRKPLLATVLPSLLFAQGPQTTDNHIKVDQFGYRPGDVKIAVISNPVTGYNSNQPFTPGSTGEVRKWTDRTLVYSAALTSWNSGATHAQSGDKVWWFDFSSLTAPGSYYVYDPARSVGSYRFEINACVYNEVLKQAGRTFYYQRCGCTKTASSAGTGWADAECHVAALQDRDCRLVSNTAASTGRDLSGGWHDAGDYNKYVNFAWSAVIDLLLAYEEAPAVWGDDWNLPESGNSIPDLLDEVKYELDWLLRMQQTDGSVLCVVGGGGASPPSADAQQRKYGPATTSATFSASSMFALGAIEFGAAGQSAYASTLRTAAESAWTWAQAHAGVTYYNSGTLAAGEQEVDAYGTLCRQVAAAAFLYALTGTAAYRTVVDANYAQMHLIQWTFAYPFESTQQDVLLYYAKTTGASTAVATDIRNTFSQSVSTTDENLPSFTGNLDAYRAYLKDGDYTWGSNANKCRRAVMYTDMLTYNLDAAHAADYRAAALGVLNYLHGVNPLAYVYLSNMGAYGAENSVAEFYHSWFAHGSTQWDRAGTSAYGPAPGFVPGGPNPSWGLDACCPSGCSGSNALCVTLSPPSGQPIQKSYLDWNTSWPQNSWEVTENGIYYQAAYVRLLSRFAGTSCASTRARGPGIPSVPRGAGRPVTLTFAEPPRSVAVVVDPAGSVVRRIRPGPGARNVVIDMRGLPAGIYAVHGAAETCRILWSNGR